ncbi:MAG: tandem-95 repeat protein [Chloroflexi bacterium]|nr:tandem-95 repeat protein [Chloroflexota bacterium]MCI0576882.1 tandem-95 repeat protein [Chloroflexota bacterium]MCI0729915.1 tandem-95 repeat protein [Chloroflexota bacterium]
MATWFKSSTTGVQQDILSAVQTSTGLHGVLLELNSSGRLRFLHRFPTGVSGGVNIISPASFTDGQWHYATAVRQGDNLYLYVDGDLAGQATASANATSSMNVTLGRLSNSTRFFNGQLDQTLMIPAAVDPDGVQLLMNTTWPIINIAADFVTFADPAGQAVEVSGSATVDENALSSIHHFDEEVEAALDLLQVIQFPSLDLPNTTLKTFVPFEDVPGSSTVENATSTSEYSCSGDRCPTLGLRGFIDRAAHFDGFNDQLLGGVPGATYAVWVKADQGTIFSGINGNGPGIALDTNRLFVAMTSVGTQVFYAPYELPISIPRNEWTHVAVVIDKSVNPANAHVYLNGQFYDSLEITRYNEDLRPIGATYSLGIGGYSLGANVDGSDPLRGYLDDYRAYAEILSAAQIQTLYNLSAPLMRFEFDEDASATAFLDISQNGYVGLPQTIITFSNTLSQTITTLNPTPGTDGKIGHTALFNGDGYITIEEADAIGALTNNFTLMGWIKPDNVTDLQRILSSGRSITNNGIGFGIYAGGLIFTTYGIKDYIQPAPLEAGVWQHVAVVLDSNDDAHFYVDGVLIDTVTHNAPAVPNPDDPLYLGVNAETDGSFNQYFSGQIDELAAYGRALSAAEITSIYLRELRWYRDRAVFQVTVDTDDPTITLLTTAQYRSNSYQQLVVNATDPTSRVALLDFGLKGPNDTGFNWQNAPVCQEAVATGAVWCPYFNPAELDGEGSYTVKFRAVDVVGNETISPEYVFFVDGTAPNAASAYNNTAMNLAETGDLNWSIDLSGTLADPELNTTPAVAGSGVDPTSVLVTLVDETGRIVGKIGQPAIVSGANWSLIYRIKGFRPLGVSTIQLTVADLVGNQATHAVGTLRFDERPPQASFNRWLMNNTVISDTATLTGPASDQADWGGEQIAFHFEAPVTVSGTTTLHDSAAYERHAVCLTCPTVDPNGVFGQAVEFGNNNHAVSFSHLFNPAETGFTAALWFKPGAIAADYRVLIQQDDSTTSEPGQVWLAYQDNRLVSFLGGSVISSPAVVNEGQWHHAAVTYDGVTVRLYLDGQLVASEAGTAPGNSDGAMKLGVSQLLTHRFVGSMDEVFIYDRVLAAEEIFALAYTQGVGLQSVELALQPLDFAAIATGVISATTPGWQTAVLNNDTWQYQLSAGLEGFYDIALRATDNYNNIGRDNLIWRGLIDNVPPVVAATGQHIGGGSAAQTEYTFSFSDFVLDETSYVQPCGTGELVSLRYSDATLPYDGLPYQVTATCRVPGHDTSRDFTACDSVGHCATQTITLPPSVDVDSVAIFAPADNSVLTATVPISVSGGAYDLEAIQNVTVYANDVVIDVITPGGTVTDTLWATTWTPTAGGTYSLTAVMRDQANNTLTDTIAVSVSDVMAIGDATVNEVAGAADFLVTLSAAQAVSVTVGYATLDGGAVAPGDYQAINGTLTIPAGQVTGTITVSITDDVLYEGPEAFLVTISTNADGLVVADGIALATIVDDEPLPTLDIQDELVAESAAVATLTATLSPLSAFTETINYVTVNGTATAPADYLTTTGTLVFAPATAAVTMTIPLVDDALDEPDESFAVYLGGAVNIGDGLVLVTIADDDETPLAAPDVYTTTEEVVLAIAAPGVLDNDSDGDGDVITATLAAGPANGDLSLNPDGSFTYTPTLNFFGTDVFTYTAGDGVNTSAPTAVTLLVAGVNDPPVAVDDEAQTQEDTAVTIDVLANDLEVDGQALAVVSVSQPVSGTAVINPDETVTYSPAANFYGVEFFTYKISDGVYTDTATVTVTVTSVNDPPILQSLIITPTVPDEGQEVSFEAVVSDPDLLRRVNGMLAVLWDFGDGATAAGTLTPTHTYADNATLTVTLTLTDTQGGVSVYFNPLLVNNVAPQVEAGEAVTVTVGAAAALAGSFADPGQDSHTITWDFGDGQTASGTLTPTHLYENVGVYTVTLTVTDDDGGVGSDQVVVTVIPARLFLPIIVGSGAQALGPGEMGALSAPDILAGYPTGQDTPTLPSRATADQIPVGGRCWYNFYCFPRPYSAMAFSA